MAGQIGRGSPPAIQAGQATCHPLIYLTPTFTRITDYTAADVIGRKCLSLRGSETDPAKVQTLREIGRTVDGLVDAAQRVSDSANELGRTASETKSWRAAGFTARDRNDRGSGEHGARGH